MPILTIIIYKKVNYITYRALYGTNLNKNKMTAVELIEQRLKFEMDIVQMDYNNGVQMSMSVFYGILKKILIQVEQAKEMEKEQIIDAWNNGFREFYDGSSTPEEYYNKTFKSK